jgi:hypothetical protein
VTKVVGVFVRFRAPRLMALAILPAEGGEDPFFKYVRLTLVGILVTV